MSGEVVIMGKPVSKARPRFFRLKNGKGVVTVNKQRDEEQALYAQAFERIKAAFPTPSIRPIALTMTFFVERPKSHFTKKGVFKPSSPLYPTGKPDVDNYEKFVMDCLNGLLYVDDSQVIKKYGEKAYATQARTVIQWSEI